MHGGKRLRDIPSSYIDRRINKDPYTFQPARAIAFQTLG